VIQSEGGTYFFQEILQSSKIKALFVFASLRNFDSFIETAQEDALLFVNHISEIVHSSVEKFGGAPNKNIGDSFIFVWKLQQEGRKIEEALRPEGKA